MYTSEEYCKLILPLSHRSALAKFRCGVAPIRLETGRYEHLPVEQRKCIFCSSNVIETEMHVLLECSLYDDLRNTVLKKANLSNALFSSMNMEDRFIYILSSKEMIRVTAKACFNILQRRMFYLCK